MAIDHSFRRLTQGVCTIALSFIFFLLFIAQPSLVLAGTVPAESAPETVLAGLSDEQVRLLLLEELKKDHAAASAQPMPNEDLPGPGAFLGNMLSSLSNKSDSSDEQARQMLAGVPHVPSDLYRVFISLCPYGTAKGAFGNLMLIFGFITLGLLFEFFFKRLVITQLFAQNGSSQTEAGNSNGNLLVSNLAKELPAILGLLLFFGASYFTYFAFIWTDSPFVQLFFLAVLLCITMIRAISICSRILLAPANASFRILPMDCKLAATLHSLVVRTCGYIILVMMFVVVAKKLGAQPVTLSILQLFFATLLLAVTAMYALIYKQTVKEHILAAAAVYDEQPSWGRARIASIWHLLALAYLFTLWILVFSDLIDPDAKSRGAFLLSFFVVPIWMVCDRIIQWLVKYAMTTLKIHQDDYGEAEATEEEIEQRERGRQSYLRMLRLARTALVLVLTLWVASLWDMTFPIFKNLTGALFDTLIIMTLALVFWQFISNLIERKIQESLPKETENEDKDDEWGAAANRGRSYTLLPMLRKFIGTVLVTMVLMTVLSSLGVDIGPLLAGAGVIGLAVGFGAQKLVADVFSGFFYLLDDAFRVGEYIEAGGITGAVENISLRNVMLRHHRGMLQIVPHSELGAITNYMRGGIVVKFNLDFPYDADIDKIRKIIKKVGQAMLQDEEFGEDILQPVKSQGVREISNSVMTIRVKFTAKPGAHFVIRREAYKRITEALREKGIHYAHRKVIVDIPQGPNGISPDEAAQIANTAAGAAAEEASKQPQGGPPESGKTQIPGD